MFQPLSKRVFAFISENEGSNCFLLMGKKELALVDSSSSQNTQEIINGLSSLGLGKESIGIILHTHGHADHFGCDSAFPNARLAMHEPDASELNSSNREFACMQLFPKEKNPKISIVLKESQPIDLGSLSLNVVHTPGHTQGSVCFFLAKEGMLFSGDTLFSGGFGRTDLPSGSSQKMAESLKKLEKMAFKGLLSGHGPLLFGEQQNSLNLSQVMSFGKTNAFL